jgi:hypothetical protein
MRSSRLLPLLVAVAALCVVACSGDSEPSRRDGGTSDGPKKGDGPNNTGKTLTWIASETLDENRAGKYTAIASCGDKIGVAYFRTLKDQPVIQCPATPLGPGAKKPRPAQDVYYVQFDGSAWGAPVKIDQSIGAAYGLSVTMEPGSCTAHVGYLGGELSLVECSSSDAVVASSSDGGQTWNKKTVSGSGGVGDTVGHWMSVAVDSTGTVHSAYRDVHFGFYEQDGNKKASLWYDNTKVSGDNGSGTYAMLAFDASDNPVIMHYNGTEMGTYGGLQIAYNMGASWELDQVLAGSTSERPSLATDGQGKFGIAYYKPSKQALHYMESSDLKTWDDLQVDTNLTRNGEFSSLAFDSQGNPAIAYYLCNDYNETTCDFTKDGLNFAHRVGTKWKVHEKVDTGDTQRCGEYAALTFDTADEPVIAYKCVAYDNLSGEWTDTLKVIRGVYK